MIVVEVQTQLRVASGVKAIVVQAADRVEPLDSECTTPNAHFPPMPTCHNAHRSQSAHLLHSAHLPWYSLILVSIYPKCPAFAPNAHLPQCSSVPKCPFPQMSICPSPHMPPTPICPIYPFAPKCPFAPIAYLPWCSFFLLPIFPKCPFAPKSHLPQCSSILKCPFAPKCPFPKHPFVPVPTCSFVPNTHLPQLPNVHFLWCSFFLVPIFP